MARLPNKSGKPDAHGEIMHPRPPPPRPTRTLVGSDPIATLRAFGKRWVLDSDGSIDGFGDDGTPEVRYGVKGPASAMIACGDALVVTHEHGRVARVSPTSGTLLSDYRYGWRAATSPARRTTSGRTRSSAARSCSSHRTACGSSRSTPS